MKQKTALILKSILINGFGENGNGNGTMQHLKANLSASNNHQNNAWLIKAIWQLSPLEDAITVVCNIFVVNVNYDGGDPTFYTGSCKGHGNKGSSKRDCLLKSHATSRVAWTMNYTKMSNLITVNLWLLTVNTHINVRNYSLVCG